MAELPITVWQVVTNPSQAIPLAGLLERFETLAPTDLRSRLAAANALPDVFLIHGWDADLAQLIGTLPCVWIETRKLSNAEIRVAPNAGASVAVAACVTAINLASARAMRSSLASRSVPRVASLRAEPPRLTDFGLHFQPQWSIDGENFIGAEALLRWHGLAVNDISPEALVTSAEVSGEMARIGDWVIDYAAWQLAAWSTVWPARARIAVNVTPSQLRDKRFVGHLDRALARHDLDAARIELEIAANVLEHLDGRHLAAVAELSEIGVNFAIDRLGATLIDANELERLPAMTWKFDRALVARSTDPAVAHLIGTFTDIARSLDIRTIAVGVENAGQQRRLSDLGCDAIQGFFLAEAMPAAELGGLLTARSERRQLGNVRASR